MNNIIKTNLGLNTLQEIRIIHALMESDFKIYLSESQLWKFNKIIKDFNLEVESNYSNCSLLPITFSHKEPFVKIGNIIKPLLFSKGMFNFCKNLWNNDKEYYIGFLGLLTEKRIIALKNICNKFSIQLNDKISSNYIETDYGKIFISQSNKGRKFPEKSWDEDYLKLLSKCKFVFCPDGDFAWTYRFFESIMCGAIPIVESNIPLYDKFIFYNINQSIEEYKWSEEIILYNFKQCKDLLTIDKDILNKEISKIL